MTHVGDSIGQTAPTCWGLQMEVEVEVGMEVNIRVCHLGTVDPQHTVVITSSPHGSAELSSVIQILELQTPSVQQSIACSSNQHDGTGRPRTLSLNGNPDTASVTHISRGIRHIP